MATLPPCPHCDATTGASDADGVFWCDSCGNHRDPTPVAVLEVLTRSEEVQVRAAAKLLLDVLPEDWTQEEYAARQLWSPYPRVQRDLAFVIAAEAAQRHPERLRAATAAVEVRRVAALNTLGAAHPVGQPFAVYPEPGMEIACAAAYRSDRRCDACGSVVWYDDPGPRCLGCGAG